MDLAFFGLTKDNIQIYRKNLYSQIHEIVFHGNGGYTWVDVYNMPTWLRKYTYHEMKIFYENKNKPNNPDSLAINRDGTVANPNIFKDQQNIINPGPKINPTSTKRPITYK